jgi:hypothetical protein
VRSDKFRYGSVVRYFFDIRNGSFEVDDVGVELPSLTLAIGEARRILASIAPKLIESGHSTVAVDIRDADRLLYTATLTFAVSMAT